jgi:hypothetical protein
MGIRYSLFYFILIFCFGVCKKLLCLYSGRVFENDHREPLPLGPNTRRSVIVIFIPRTPIRAVYYK